MIGRPERIVLKRDPACETEGDAMEFRLTYEGLLLGASRNETRAKHKHEIRKVFHKQLRRLAEVHPAFEFWHDAHQGQSLNVLSAKPQIDEILNKYSKFGFKLFPIATRDLSLLCYVHILFLRPDTPGAVIRSGDIDNRLKTIFDALRLPHDKTELGGYAPDADEDPLICLLEDDSLISHAAVETDTLLQPTGSEWNANDARLVITVRLSPYRVTYGNIGFGG